MKLLFLLTYYAPHWTGLTEHAKRLAEALVQEGEDVTVLTTKHDSSLVDQQDIHGVTVKRTSVLFRLSRTMVSPSLWLRMWHEIGRHEVVLIYTPFAEVLLAAVFARIRGKRLLFLHNGDLLLPKGILNWGIERIFDISGHVACHLADHLIAYSEDYANHSRFLRPFRNKTTAILPLFPPVADDQSAIRTLKKRLPGKPSTVIGFAGRFVEEKGFDLLLQAIPIVVQKIPDALFVFAGETHMAYEHFFERHQQLLAQVTGNFYSFGLLDRKEMTAFYQLLDVFVLPSRSDCLALVQVEAMLARVPVVVTDIPGARVAVVQTGMGTLVTPGNPAALARGIMNVVKKKNVFQKQMSEVTKMFDYQKTLRQYQLVLKGNYL